MRIERAYPVCASRGRFVGGDDHDVSVFVPEDLELENAYHRREQLLSERKGQSPRMTNLQTALAVGTLALTVITTGIGVSCSVNSTAVALHGEIRQDLRTLNDDVKDLGERVTRVETQVQILIAGGGQVQAGGGGAPTVTPPPGND